jgi:hypothetical protein
MQKGRAEVISGEDLEDDPEICRKLAAVRLGKNVA